MLDEYKKNLVLISFILILSVVLVIPGVLLPVMHLEMDTKIVSTLGQFEVKGLDKNRSIVGTILDLAENGRFLVCGLIAVFSILVPMVKSLLLFWVTNWGSEAQAKRSVEFVNAIGKWSMADVFVVAVFLVYLSLDSQNSVKSFDVKAMGASIPVEMTTVFTSTIGPGFYFFLSYCIISIASLPMIQKTILMKSKMAKEKFVMPDRQVG